MTQQINLPSFEKLNEKLASDPLIERYRLLTEKVHQNQKLLALYDEYIKKQKDLIKVEHYGKSNAKLQKEAELKALEDELQIQIMDMDDTGILNINYDYKTGYPEKITLE